MTSRLPWASLLMAACLLLSFNEALAAPGERDPTFGSHGIVRVDADPAAANAEDRIEVDSAGRYVVLATSAAGSSSLLRFERDGSLDSSFGGDGSVAIPSGTWRDLALDRGGGIVVVGAAEGTFAVERFDPAGNLDADFGDGGSTTTGIDSPAPANKGEERKNEFERVEIQPDGGVVALGNVSGCYGGSEPRCYPRSSAAVRYSPGGHLDSSFGAEGLAALNVSRLPSGLGPYALGSLHSLALQPDGAILVGGTTGQDLVLVRLTPGGTLDASFAGDGHIVIGRGRRRVIEEELSPGVANAIVIQNDARILAVGRHALVALRLDGSLDLRFGRRGVASIINSKTTNLVMHAADAVVDEKGRILLAGDTESLTAVSRFYPNGSHDPRFAGDGLAHVNLSMPSLHPKDSEEAATDIALDPDGSPVTAGFAFSGQQGAVALVRFRGGDGRLARCKGKRAILQGTPRAEKLSAGGGPIVAFGGDDRIRSSGGLVCAGTGDDLVRSPNYGTIYGQAGDDSITGNDRGRVYGGRGDDTIRSHPASSGRDSYFGGLGRDLLVGGKGPDRLFGGPGADRLIGGGGRDLLLGGAGADLLIGGFGTDRLLGGGGRDRVFPGADSPPEAVYVFRRPRLQIRLTVRRHRIAGLHVTVRLRCSDGGRSTLIHHNNNYRLRIDRRGRFREKAVNGDLLETLSGRVSKRFISGAYRVSERSGGKLCTTGRPEQPKLHFTARRVRR